MLRAIALATTLANAAIRIEENVPRVKKGKATFDGWRFLGPRGAASTWPSGKTEYEGDPLAAHGGVYAQLDGAAPPPRFAEHGGDLGAGAAAARRPPRLGHDHVDVQGLMRSPPLGTAQDVIHVQYWVAGKMRVTRNGTYTVSCRSLHAFELRDANGVIIGPLLGDVYGRGHATPLKLGAGAYDVVSRHVGLAAKVVGAAPDLVRGRFVNDAAVLCLELRNLSPTAWKFAHATLTAGGGFALGGAADPVSLAPGSTTSVLLRLAANGPADDVEADGCAEYEIYVAAVVVKGALRCRARSQSALMTFADGDGSLGAAGVLFPRRGDGAGNSVVLSLAGVGVSRLLGERGAGVELDSVDADHWWWDTARPNDGGAVHDDAARAFTLAAAAARRTTLADVLAKGPSTVVAGSPQTYGGRFGLRVDRFPDTDGWPVRDVGGALRVGDCAVDAADGPGAAFLAPSPAGRLDLVVTASRAETLAWLAATTFASNQPHARPSRTCPDFVLVDEDARWTGVGGVRAAGLRRRRGVASGFFSC
ncbi:hypothetical protein JL722_13553 [Aureococcus anophagefferens]|nr:hypothetical protein JL722_13553 [Aureococcus anophagefferens]